MLISFDICLALECVKKLCDNNRCTVCDKAAGQFRRYSCGHTACDVCASGTGYCVFCLTPPEKNTSNNSSLDELSTQRARNASVLLSAFETAFNVDVYNHQKMSEQLKLERDLFPECIQAPNKYFNKRKSVNNTYVKKKKHQVSKLPGEVIYPVETSKVVYSIDSVEQWFDKNMKTESKEQNVNNKNENEESGIDIDTSFIDCSQITEDKDKQALLAVYEADKNFQLSDSVLTIESEEWGDDSDIITEHPKIFKDEYKVPFFKKSKLAETYEKCVNDSSIIKISTNMFDETNNLNITIFNNNGFLKPNEFVQTGVTSAHSIPVQTDICGISDSKENIYLNTLEESYENNSLCPNLNVPSQDVFTIICGESHESSNANTQNIDIKTTAKSVFIKESDSEDEFVTEPQIIEVSAQVHRVEHPVLSNITYIGQEEFIRGQKRRRRRLTPDSSNSSEKENLNPNRQKKSKYGKKAKK